MSKSLTEIADELEKMDAALRNAGQTIGNSPEGRYQINDEQGNPIDLPSLIRDIRAHAKK